MGEYRAGVIGCGGMGTKHAHAYDALSGIKLVAAVDIVEDKVETLAQSLGFDGKYTSCEEMLAKEALDLVSVCTRNDQHAEPVIMAAEAGVKGILCEKPIALMLSEADNMIEACDKAGVVFAVEHSMRFETNYRRMKELVESSEIGELRGITILYTGDQGSLFNNATHALDGFRFYAGDADWVFAHLERAPDRQDANRENITAYIRFKSGVRGTYISGAGTDYRYESIVLEGSKGKIEALGVDGWRPLMRMWHCEKHGVKNFRDGETTEGEVNNFLETAITDLVACVEGERESISSGRDARAALELIWAIYESQRQGTKIFLPLYGKQTPLDLMLDSGQLPSIWARDLQRQW